jgi:hypothetical protein
MPLSNDLTIENGHFNLQTQTLNNNESDQLNLQT